MKQIIIFLLLIIAFFIGFGKYHQYKRYNSPAVNYTTNKTLDSQYYDQELVINYHKAIEELNSFVMMQWTVNGIDVRTPEDDNEQTKLAVKKYAKKLASIKYFETKLENSASLKNKGLSNKEIQFLEKTGTNLASYNKAQNATKIKSMFDVKEKMFYGQKSALVYEVQKKLVANGLNIKADGIYKVETLNAIKTFEEKNNLFADGILDILTLDALFH
ncbi:peptidoglycan-binding protein [Polaribacter sp. MSW13]|uniref:Peptidoglycan-binding protein n=1 Tax=Polaribacter marinus TaxID=2916838 RepID=A0A9X2AKH1_9FLAO|nr:peptidoglycan-binding domain-containing protein [Polaribacter marinus]MCI2228225.1 peptidoglycan-binding protein [Polaribacter marinus]